MEDAFPGWKAIKSSAASPKVSMKTGVADTLLPEGRGVPVLTLVDLENVTAATTGVGLVNMSIGKRLV